MRKLPRASHARDSIKKCNCTEVQEKMLYELLMILKWLPKVTLAYAAFSFLNGMSISTLIVGITLAFDLIDYLPMD